MIVVLGFYFLLYFGVFAFLIFMFGNKNKPETVAFSDKKVKVSILIAARNEAENIITCLQSITRLNYPSHLIEVLIGDDNSSDDTAKLVEAFIAGKPNFKLISI